MLTHVLRVWSRRNPSLLNSKANFLPWPPVAVFSYSWHPLFLGLGLKNSGKISPPYMELLVYYVGSVSFWFFWSLWSLLVVNTVEWREKQRSPREDHPRGATYRQIISKDTTAWKWPTHPSTPSAARLEGIHPLPSTQGIFHIWGDLAIQEDYSVEEFSNFPAK